MPDITEIKLEQKMSDIEAVSVIQKIRGCHYDDKCKMECEKCPCNFTVEQLHEVLQRAAEALRERGKA